MAMGSVVAECTAGVLIVRSGSLMMIFFRTDPVEMEVLFLSFAVLAGLEELELAFVIWGGGFCKKRGQCVGVVFGVV